MNALIRMGAFLLLMLLMVPVVLLCRVFDVKFLMVFAPVYGLLILWLGVSRAVRRIEGREEGLMEALARSTS